MSDVGWGLKHPKTYETYAAYLKPIKSRTKSTYNPYVSYALESLLKTQKRRGLTRRS